MLSLASLLTIGKRCCSSFLRLNNFSVFSGSIVVDINFELVINTGFHSDLLNRSSEKFIVMERNITSKVSKGYLAVDLRFRHSFSLVTGALL